MDSFNDLLNNINKDIEEKIRESIKDTRRQLCGLEVERTCKIYASYLYHNLKKRQVPCHVMDTEMDFGLNYQHLFIVVPKEDKFYILDLTYSQFKGNELFNKLYTDGYQLVDKKLYKEYVGNIASSVKKYAKR